MVDRSERSSATVIEALGLEPHPEGGHFRRVHTAVAEVDGRAVESAIAYLLASGESSHWHRIDAEETWSHEAGDSLDLHQYVEGEATVSHRIAAGCPDVVVPSGVWQAATPRGDWVLVRCTVRPAFVDEGFELAPPGWRPPA